MSANLMCRVYDSLPSQIMTIPGGVREYRQAAIIGSETDGDPQIISFPVDILYEDSVPEMRAKLLEATILAVSGAGYVISADRIVYSDFSKGN